ncbi:MAG: LLM class flavin-dependent oxidoreductase [Chitinophagales bacterium]|nr:LLM class flavin-dependent oxidoreductase [Chitinophagales bacterium]
MELGIGMFGDLSYDSSQQKFQPVAEKLHEIIEQVQLADDIGLDLISLGEHHRPDYSIASTEIMLAALSTVTKRIKLASGVTVLSSADPVKVYQDYATLDLISNGRAEIIAGRGSFIESFPLFGYDLKDYNSLFEEKIELLRKINEEDPVTWSGKHRAPLSNQHIYPRANQPIPIWIAVGGTPESVHRAAKLGLPLIVAIIGGQPRQFKPLIEFYKEEYLAFGHDPDKMQIGVHSHTFVAESQEKLVEQYYPLYAAQMDRVGASRGWPPYAKQQFLFGIHKEGALYMGDPNYVAEKIISTIEMFGITRYVAHIDVGAPSHQEMMQCIELFGAKVVPQIRKAISNS